MPESVAMPRRESTAAMRRIMVGSSLWDGRRGDDLEDGHDHHEPAQDDKADPDPEEAKMAAYPDQEQNGGEVDGVPDVVVGVGPGLHAERVGRSGLLVEHVG